MVGVGGGQVEEALPHALVELQRLPLDPVAPGEPAESRLGRQVQHDGQVRPQVTGRPAGDRLDLRNVEGAAGALVGQRGVDVAVGDHHVAALQRGQHDVVDVLGLVGGVEQGLGAVGQLAGGRIEHDAPQLLADLGVARLEGEQDAVAPLDQPLAQQQ